MRSADQRWRGSLAWTVAAALVLAGLAVGLGFRTVVGWLAAAVLAGLAATIAGLVQTTAKKGLAAGKELLTGTSPPLTISVEYWQQPFRFVDDPGQFDPGRLMRCGIVVLLIQATANQAVILKRIQVIIDSRDPGTYIPADPSHEPLPLRKFLVDLDQEVPELIPEGPARPRVSLMDAYHVETPDFPYTVSPHDPERLQVMAYTERHDVRWRLALDWICRDKTGTVLIDSNGQPFRVAQSPEQNRGEAAGLLDMFHVAQPPDWDRRETGAPKQAGSSPPSSRLDPSGLPEIPEEIPPGLLTQSDLAALWEAIQAIQMSHVTIKADIPIWPEPASGEIPSPRLVAAWAKLRKIPAERVPLWAAHWLADGYDGDTLRALAGLSATDDPREIRELLPHALADCGTTIPDLGTARAMTAFTQLARMHAQQPVPEWWILEQVNEIAADSGYAASVISLPLGKIADLPGERTSRQGRVQQELRAKVRQACTAQLAVGMLAPSPGQEPPGD